MVEPRTIEQRLTCLDLFCKAGGASMGLHRAGYDVTGVDIEPQPQYPFRFIQANALRLPLDPRQFDLIWASPPCQAYTGMQRINTRAPKREHPKLIEPVRDMLKDIGKPYIIENVPGAPLHEPIVLCGSMFGLAVRRHRLFECSFWTLRPRCRHDLQPEPLPVWGDGRPTRQEVRQERRSKFSPIAVYGDHPQQSGDKTYRVNRARTLREGQEAMGIDWMDWAALTQAIPPAYSEFLGRAARATS